MTTWLAGARTDARTRTMLDEAERIAGVEAIVVQGSYSDGANSAGTHAGGGALDLRTWHLSTLSRGRLLLALRTVGFAAWYRTKSQGFDPHIHAVAISCPDLSASARRQVDDYYERKNGLANHGSDDGPWMRPIRTWEQYQADQHLPDTGGDDVSQADVTAALRSPEGQQAIADAIAAALRDGHVARRELSELAGIGVHGQRLGRSGPSIGTAIQSLYMWAAREAADGNPRAAAALAAIDTDQEDEQ